jgi:hypothetical protein
MPLELLADIKRTRPPRNRPDSQNPPWRCFNLEGVGFEVALALAIGRTHVKFLSLKS